MIPITTLGWTCDGLLSRSPRFRAVPRISILDPSLSATIDAHTSSGTPLIIEDLHRHPRWPKEMFGVDWFATHGPQEVNVRDVCKRKDSKMPIADFISKSRAASIYATAEEPNRYYAKDAECPKAWADWLYDARLIPETFVPHGSDDLSKYLPKNQSVETLMCYLGIGDTFTPCHKDLCASSGHNLMCYTENNGSSFWFMTQSSQASTVANYFHELGEELDWETHTISVDELVKAPFDTYIGEQKLGDFMLVPPRSCHQVVNQGGLTVKTSWSRMTLKGLATALHDELPIYRRVCRPEVYRIKSTIHHAMLHQTTMLEQHSMSLQAPGSDDIDHKSHNELQTFGRDLSRKLTSLLELFQEIVTDEYCPGQETVPKVVADFSHTAYADTGYSTFTCDFCGADIFLSFFECQSCVPDPESESGSDTRQTLGDGLLICPGCFVEGRTCLCGEMTPVQIWSYDHLIADYNRAFQALSKVRAVGRTAFSELRTGHISLSEDRVGVFDAACLLYGLRRTGSRIQKDVAPCNFKRPLHTVPSLECFICKKCHRSRCLKCLLTDGIHCSEVFYHHGKDKEHSEWHEYHLSTRRLYTDARRQATSAEGSGDTMSKLSGYRLTLAASTFPRCLPLHEAYIRLGWYDQRPSRHASAPSPMDMSTALDKTMEEHIHGWTDGQSVDGLRDASPISDIAAPSTKPTPAPPPRKGPPGLRHSVVQAKESPPILSDPPPRVKRKSSSFEGVVVSKGEKKRRVGPASRTATSASASASTSAAATAKVPEDNSRTNGTVEHARPAAEDTIDSQKVLESHSKILENIMEQNKQIMNLFSERTRDLKDVVKRQGQSTNAFLERKLEEVKSALSKQTEENKAIRKELSDVKSKLEQLNGDTVESLGRIKELLTEPREEDPEDTPPPPANVPQPQPQPQVQRKQAAVQRAQEPAVETAWVPREGYPPEHAAPHQPRRQETYSKHEQHDYPPEQYDDHAYQRGSWQGGYHQAYTRAPYRGRAHYKPRGNRGYRYYNDYRQQRPNQYYQPHPQPHPYYGHDSYEPDPYYDGEYAAPNPNPRPPPQSYPAHVSAPHTYPPTPASNPPAQASGSKPQSAPPPVQARSQHSHAHAHQHQHAHAHAEQHPRSQHVEHHARAPSRKSSQLTVRADREEPRRHREREDPIPQQSSPSPRTPSSTGYYASYRTGSGSDATYSDQELAGGGKSSRE